LLKDDLGKNTFIAANTNPHQLFGNIQKSIKINMLSVTMQDPQNVIKKIESF